MKNNSIWEILNPVKKQINLTYFCAILSSIFSISAITSLAFFITSLDENYFPWKIIFITTLMIFLAFICRIYSSRTSHLAAFKLEHILRLKLCQKFNRISLGQIQMLGTGTMSKVIYDDVKELHGFVADSTPLFPGIFVALILIPTLLFYFNWQLALLNIFLLIGIFLFIQIFQKQNIELMQQYNKSRESVNSSIIEYIQAMPIVRTFDSGYHTYTNYQNALNNYSKFVSKWYRDVAGFGNWLQLLFNPLLILIFLLWLGSWLYIGNQITAFTWIAIILLSSGLSEIIQPWFMMQTAVEAANIAVNRIYEIQNLPELSEVKATEAKLPKDSSIEFKNVSFNYNNQNDNALSNISFIIPSGHRSALIGPSGAGKTTIARLIPRFWDVTAGAILIGGVDIRNISSTALMDQIAFVFQDNFLFSFSIAENIRIGKLNATDEEIIEAAKLAQAHDFIMELPNKYKTNVGERGVFLSGGQKQRITIARAILQNKPILILDEATAFADPENEHKIMQALTALMKNKTVVIVAHRLSTIKNCDEIFVFDHGKLIEKGNHQTLINLSGLYSQLWKHNQIVENWQLHTTT